MRKKLLFCMSFILIVSCGVDSDLSEKILSQYTIELVFPENASECNEGVYISELESDITFRWEGNETNEGYKIHVTNLLDEVTNIYDSSENQLTIRLLRGTPYSWFVTNLNEVAVSSTWSFYNAGDGDEAFIPFPANILSPTPNTTFSSNTSNVVLDWEGNDLDNDIQHYDIFFGNTTPPPLYDSITDNILSVPVTSSNTYYWFVITRDSIGNESMSDISTFIIE